MKNGYLINLKKRELRKKFSKITDDIYKKYFQKEHYELYKELLIKVKKLIDSEYSSYKKYIKYPKQQKSDELNDGEYEYVLFEVDWDKIKTLDEDEQDEIINELEYHLVSDINAIANTKKGLYNVSNSIYPCTFYLHWPTAKYLLKTQQISENNELLFEVWVFGKKNTKQQTQKEDTFNKYYEAVANTINQKYPTIKKIINDILKDSEYKELHNSFIWEKQLKTDKYECKILTVKENSDLNLVNKFINKVNNDNFVPYIRLIKKDNNIYIEYTQKLLRA